jgi:hypothetical protein
VIIGLSVLDWLGRDWLANADNVALAIVLSILDWLRDNWFQSLLGVVIDSRRFGAIPSSHLGVIWFDLMAAFPAPGDQPKLRRSTTKRHRRPGRGLHIQRRCLGPSDHYVGITS